VKPTKKRPKIRLIIRISIQIKIGPLLQFSLTDIIKQKPAILVEKCIDQLLTNFDFLTKTSKTYLRYDLSLQPTWGLLAQFWSSLYQSMFCDKQKIYAPTHWQSKTDSTQTSCLYCLIVSAIKLRGRNKLGEHDKKALTLIINAQIDGRAVRLINNLFLNFIIYQLALFPAGPNWQSYTKLCNIYDNGCDEWWTKYDPLLKSLTEEPEFQTLMQFIYDDLRQTSNWSGGLICKK